VSNACLIDYGSGMCCRSGPLLATVLDSMGRHGLMVFDTSHNMPMLKGPQNTTQYWHNGLTGRRCWCWRDIGNVDGVHWESSVSPRDAWFVAIHARETRVFRRQDESAHAHRNSDIRRLIPAIREISAPRRMGDPHGRSDHATAPAP